MKSKNRRKRRLAAIMYTDIVGYSAMMQEDEERAIALRDRHREVFKRFHEQFDGTVLQYYGDGTLSIFDSTADAVECAVKMQQILGDSPVVPLRISVHTGDITYDEEDAYGDGLNVAARLEPLCNPGGIFISGKTYDDIKNHPFLRAESLGFFDLKNIREPVEIYAVANEGVEFPDVSELPSTTAQREEAPPQNFGRKKSVAALLAFFLGSLGIHRFYLGQKGLGITYFVISLIGIMGVITEGDAEPIFMTTVIGMIALLDALIFMVMPKANFDRKFNQAASSSGKKAKKEKRSARRKRYASPARPTRTTRTSAFPESRRPAPVDTVPSPPQRRKTIPNVNPLELRGLQNYNARNIDGAIADFEQALDTDPDNPAIYFILAKCFSLKENAREAFLYLDRAVELGFDDFDQIRREKALAFLRSHALYETYVRNGYRWPSDLPPPGEDLLSQQTPKKEKGDLIQQLLELENLYKRGILTEEEYIEQRNRFNGQ